MPYDRSKYPPNWKEISQVCKDRAGNKCERCGLSNGEIGFRNDDGNFIRHGDTDKSIIGTYVGRHKVFKIVLTVAHVGPNKHDKQNCTQLESLCQRCHLIEDIEEHRINRSATLARRKASGIGVLEL